MGQNKDRPFLAYYSMALCHEISDDFSPVPPPGPDGKYVSYAGMVADMDRMVGKLVAALEKLGLRERTVVIFTTDNGSPARYLTDVTHEGGKARRHHQPVVSKMGDREVRGGKGSLSDWGTRVPLIVNWPGTTPPGRTVDDLVDFSDFLPTLAELAGAEVPEAMQLDGRSFAPQIKGLAGEPRPWAFSESRGKYWIRTQRWKLTYDGKLFDTEADPDEKHPIKPGQGPPEAAEARKQLQSALKSLGRAGD
jgi:arylsulfatase A-like enzyme